MLWMSFTVQDLMDNVCDLVSIGRSLLPRMLSAVLGT